MQFDRETNTRKKKYEEKKTQRKFRIGRCLWSGRFSRGSEQKATKLTTKYWNKNSDTKYTQRESEFYIFANTHTHTYTATKVHTEKKVAHKSFWTQNVFLLQFFSVWFYCYNSFIFFCNCKKRKNSLFVVFVVCDVIGSPEIFPGSSFVSLPIVRVRLVFANDHADEISGRCAWVHIWFTIWWSIERIQTIVGPSSTVCLRSICNLVTHTHTHTKGPNAV